MSIDPNIRIIYPWKGGVAVLQIIEYDGLTIDQLARREVPAGIPYRVITTSDLPASDDQREAWYVDEADYSDGFGERPPGEVTP